MVGQLVVQQLRHVGRGVLVISISSKDAGWGLYPCHTYAFVCGSALAVAKVQVHGNRRNSSSRRRAGSDSAAGLRSPGQGLTIKPNVRRVWPYWTCKSQKTVLQKVSQLNSVCFGIFGFFPIIYVYFFLCAALVWFSDFFLTHFACK